MTIRRPAADVVQFTRESAERISRVVRESEMAPLPGSALSLGALLPEPRRVFRMCTFTAAWNTGTSQTVTFMNQTSTPNTVVAQNLFYPIPNAPPGEAACGIARHAGEWYLLAVPFVTQTCVSDIQISATLNTSDCTISVGTTLTTTNILSLTY